MVFFVILLNQTKLIAVKEEWVQDPTLLSNTKFYFSPDQNAVADFNSASKYYFDENRPSCYNGYVCKTFGM